MNKKTQQVRAWKELMKMVANIQDPLLKRGMIAEFRTKALRDWGWDPTTGNLATQEAIELDEWEKQFHQDIQDSKTFGFNVREDKQTEEYHKAKVNMMAYVRDGGTLGGIPDNIRTPDIEKLYWECREAEHQEMMAQCDNIIAQIDEGQPGPEPIGAILPRVLREIENNMKAHNNDKNN